MKKLDQIVLQKRLFASIKRHLRLTNKHLDNPEDRQLEVEFPLMGSYFLVSFIYIKKNSFFHKGHF